MIPEELLDQLAAEVGALDEQNRRVWSWASKALDGGCAPFDVARTLGMHQSTMYRHLKVWVPDRSGDGRSRWVWTSTRARRGVPRPPT